jgi:glutathione peroxidase
MLTDRRRMLTFLAGSFATPAFFVPPAFAQAPAMTRVTAYAFAFAGLEGPDIRLADHAGKPILVVNTASLCGYTPQYAGLQQLWTRYHGRGLMIVGVPSNDFGGQEPGGTADIMRTAHGDYGIGFALAAKAQVKGPNPHPTSGRPPSAPWKRRAGTFTNTSSAATATSPRFLPPRSSRWTPASSTRS